MTEETTQSGDGRGAGLIDSFKNIGASLLAIVQTRLELLSVELEEEKARLGWLLLLAGVALFCLGLGVFLITLLIVAAFWESHRLMILGSLALLYVMVGVGLWLAFLSKARAKPRLFGASLDELSKDRDQTRLPR